MKNEDLIVIINERVHYVLQGSWQVVWKVMWNIARLRDIARIGWLRRSFAVARAF